MANQKISQMPSLTASELAAGDLLAVVDVSDVTQASSGSNKKITVTELQSAAVSAGTANGVLYLNGSKQATSGSALTYNGTNVQINASNFPSLKFGDSGATVKGELYYGVGGNDLNLANYTNGPIGFITNGSEQMRLTSTGLGIGTSSPSAKLDVSNGAFQGVRTFLPSISDTYHQYKGTPDGLGYEHARVYSGRDTSRWTYGSYLAFYTEGKDAGATDTSAERLRIDSAGNLGLGITPSAWGTGYKAINIAAGGAIYANTNTSAAINIGTNVKGANIFDLQYQITGQGATQYNQYNGVHSWFTAPSGTAGDAISFTQAMTLDASGSLILAAGDFQFNRTSAFLYANGGSGGNVNSGFYLDGSGNTLRMYTGNAERARIDSSGNLLVGRTSFVSGSISYGTFKAAGNDAYGVTIANASTTDTRFINFADSNDTSIGSINQSGPSVSYNTSSDYRLKTITGPITNSGAYIDSLNPVEGTWKADGSTFVGLIAHEVQEVSRTQVATGEKDGAEMQAMDYSNSELIANLIAEVKSLRARVAALESN